MVLVTGGLATMLTGTVLALRETDLTSGIHTLLRTPHGWSGGADPRREGVVAGD